MRTKSMFLVLLILGLFSLASLQPGLGVLGLDVWDEDDYIIYNLDLDRDFDETIYSPDIFPEWHINRADVGVEFQDIDRGQMVFDITSEDEDLNNILTFPQRTIVDPNTGLNSDGGWEETFFNTTEFVDGEEIDEITFGWIYNDFFTGIQTVEYSMVVEGEPEILEVKIDGNPTEVEVWTLVLDKTIINFNHFEFNTPHQLIIEDTMYKITDFGGVMMELTFIVTEIEIGEPVPSFVITYDQTVNEVHGVQLTNPNIGSSAPGFEFVYLFISLAIFSVLIHRKTRH